MIALDAQGEILRYLETYPSLAACERARAAGVGSGGARTVCSVGQRSLMH